MKCLNNKHYNQILKKMQIPKNTIKLWNNYKMFKKNHNNYNNYNNNGI